MKTGVDAWQARRIHKLRTNLTIAKLAPGMQRSHNLQEFQRPRIEWHHLDALDALVLSCGRRRTGITPLNFIHVKNHAGFWRLRFDSSCGLSYAMPSSSCSFLHIRSWRGPSAKSNKSKISGISESRSRNWLERIVHAAALKTPQSQIGMVLNGQSV